MLNFHLLWVVALPTQPNVTSTCDRAWQDTHPRGSSAARALVSFTPCNYCWLMQVLICMYYAGSVESQGLSMAWSRLPGHGAALCTGGEACSRRDDPLGQAWVWLLAQKGDIASLTLPKYFQPDWSLDQEHSGAAVLFYRVNILVMKTSNPSFPYLFLVEQGVWASFPHYKAEFSTQLILSFI